MSELSEDAVQRIVAAFNEHFWADELSGERMPLSHYLELFDDHQDLIIAEYEANTQNVTVASNDGPVGRHPSLQRLGPYELGKELGRGGQGVVYVAIDKRLRRKVALKVLTGIGPGSEDHLRRFRREAEVASRLDHPGICGVHDVGLDGAIPYIAMRYIEGNTLAAKITATRNESAGPSNADTFMSFDDDSNSEVVGENRVAMTSELSRPQLSQLLLIFEKAARALHAAHEAGILHRDIKPGNIMLTPQGEPVILDFGLARDDSEAAGPSLTETGDVFGTPAYMSPEQIAGLRHRIDRRSDLYSLGVSLYESLTLRRPFEAPTREALYQAVLTQDCPDPQKLNRLIPKDLKVVLETVLDKDSDRRYQTAEALADELAAIREHRPIAARPLNALQKTARWARRRPVRAALIATLVICLPLMAGMSGYIWANQDEIDRQRTAQRLENAEGALEKGFFNYRMYRYEEARQSFEESLVHQPHSVEALAGLSLTLLRLKKPESALQVTDRVSPADVPIMRGLRSDILMALGRHDEARRSANHDDQGNRSILWFLAAMRHVNKGDKISPTAKINAEIVIPPEAQAEYRKAFVLLKRAILSSPRARRAYHYLLASLAPSLQDSDEAEEVVKVMNALWPNSADTEFFSGQALKTADPDRAITHLRRAAEDEHLFGWAQEEMAYLLAGLGRTEEAMAVYQESLKRAPRTYRRAALLSLGTLAHKLGQDELAESSFRTMIAEETPGTEGVLIGHCNLANSLMQQGRFAAAETTINDCLVQDPEHSIGLNILGQILIKSQRQDEAHDVVWRLLKCEDYGPTVLVAPVMLAQYYITNGKRELATQIMETMEERAPTSTPLIMLQGHLHFDRQEYDEAVAHFRRYRDLCPEQKEGHQSLAHTLAQAGHHKESLEALAEATETLPNEGSLWRQYATALGNSGELDKAIEALHEAIAVAPKDHENHVILGNAFLSQKKLSLAEEALEKAKLLAPKALRVLDLQSRIQSANGETEEALLTTKELLVVSNYHELSLNMIGHFTSVLGRPEEHESILQDVIEARPQHPSALKRLAALLMQRGDKQEAEALLLRHLKVRPDDLGGHLNLAQILTNAGQFEALKNHLEPVLERAAVAPLLNLAQSLCLEQTGEIAKAVDSLVIAERQFAMVMQSGKAPPHTDFRKLKTLKIRDIIRARVDKMVRPMIAKDQIAEALSLYGKVAHIFEGDEAFQKKIEDFETKLAKPER